MTDIALNIAKEKRAEKMKLKELRLEQIINSETFQMDRYADKV